MAKRSRPSRSDAPLVSAAARRTLLFLALAVLGVILAVGLLLPGKGPIADALRNVVAPWFGAGRWLLPPLLLLTGLWVERRAESTNLPLLRFGVGLVALVALLALVEVLFPGHGGLIGRIAGGGAGQMLTGVGAFAAWFAVLVAAGLALNAGLVRRIFRSLFAGAQAGAGLAATGVATAAPVIADGSRSLAARLARLAVRRPAAPAQVPSAWEGRAPAEGHEPDAIEIAEVPPAAPPPTGSPSPSIRETGSARTAAPASDGPGREGGVTTAARRAGAWRLPGRDLLAPQQAAGGGAIPHEKNAQEIEQKLASFGIAAEVVGRDPGPVVTRYRVSIDTSVRVNRVEALASDLAMALRAKSIRIEAPIPGEDVVGIEVPNPSGAIVGLRSVFAHPKVNMRPSPDSLTVALGLDVAGNPLVADLAKMPHLLIAGTTGSGKSVMVNALIASLLWHHAPDRLRLVLIDPKRVEMAAFAGIPHLRAELVKGRDGQLREESVIVDPARAATVLARAVLWMERRYETLAQAGVRNIAAYNERAEQRGEPPMPYIVIVVDELADLMMQDARATEEPIVRLAQKSRAVGIHLVIATQRPSVNVVTGLIKANIPSRIAFAMASQTDSRTVLDAPGAEDLLGRGDMLYQPSDAPKPQRAQGVFVTDGEVAAVVEHWRSQGGPQPFHDDDGVEVKPQARGGAGGGADADDADPLLDEAIAVVQEHDRASASLLQRRLRIGYARAARIIDQLEARGHIGAFDGSNAREVLGAPGRADVGASEDPTEDR